MTAHDLAFADGANPRSRAERDDHELAEHEALVARLLSDAELAAVVDEWAAYEAAVLADAAPPDDVDDAVGGADVPASVPTSPREVLARCASLPVLSRAPLLGRIDVSALAEWEADELVRQAASLQAAVTALQVRARLAMAASYGRLRDRAQARQDARDSAARAAGESVTPRQPVRDHSVSALMKLENVSRAAAEGRLAQAADYVSRTPRLFALLEEGAISPDVLRMVRTETATLPADSSRRVEQRLVDELDRTPGEIAGAARRAAAVIDPEAFGRRNGAARHGRRAYSKPLPDGMALLSVIGPAEHVALRWLEIDEQARALVAAGDPRTLSQLRCDLLLDAPPPPAGCTLADPITGNTFLDRRTGEVRTATWPPASSAASSSAASSSGASSSAASSAPVRRRTVQGRPVTTVLVMDLATFLGGDDVPALIQGVGPIPAAVARELAHGSRSWFRAAVDDSGVCRDYGRLRAPRQDLRDLVIRGKGSACACGCGQPAAQLDHRTEHQHGGTTSETNLDGLATRCHAEKTDAVAHGTGWTPTLLGDGTVRWTSPFGHERRVRPTDIGIKPPRRIVFYARDADPPRPPRPYDPTKPYHPLLNAPPYVPPAPDRTLSDPHAPPPF